MSDRKYTFSWDLLGDISLGRPHLGLTTWLEVYLLMQFVLRDVLVREMGMGILRVEKADIEKGSPASITGGISFKWQITRLRELPAMGVPRR